MDSPQVSILIPLFNEEETYPKLIERLVSLMDSSEVKMEVLLVDDGSTDNTSQFMRLTALSDPRFQCLFLSRNHGHQLALSAGFEYARGTEAVFVLDGDLQDPPELFPKFYEEYKKGSDVVYAIRRKRKETRFRKIAYFLYYRLLKSISYIDLPLDSGDFSLISRRVINILNKMPEESRYIRGMRSWVGFKQTGIEYDRVERKDGQSKYSFGMSLKMAYNGIFSFSEFPIKFITWLGIGAISISFPYLIVTMYKKLFTNSVPQGFTAILSVIIMFSGVQLVSIGVLGEYIIRIFFQSKKRPLFIVKEHIIEGKYKNEV